MHVHLSFDVEVWCNGWDDLDRKFPAAFERYVYGTSKHGQFALPKTLEILRRHGLRGVFFVEPLFAGRFGQTYLEEIVRLIQAAEQDVQLHLHPEWTDEIRPPLIPDVSSKRQHLIHYSLGEQQTLIGAGKAMLESCTGRPVTAFRAGSYAANADTFRALASLGIAADSSLNEVSGVSGGGLSLGEQQWLPSAHMGVTSIPVSVFRDGLGRLRPAQVGACSVAELRDALWTAHRAGCPNFVIVSHNFEMLKPGSSERDGIVAARFDQLCEFLASYPHHFQVKSYPTSMPQSLPQAEAPLRPVAGRASTGWRYVEQALRRVL